MHWIKVCGNENKAYAITPFSRVMYTEIISNSLAGCKINMLDMYKYLFLGLQQEDKVKYPHKKINEKEIEKIFLENKLKPEKTVILSPYANTVIGFPTEFWIGLASKLKEKGYCVCTNCSGDEKEIMGTIRLSVGLDIVEAVLNEAGYLIAMRSGFCDIVSNSDAYKIIIYPLYYLFNSDVYEFCSLKKMGIGKNYTEIQWRYERYDELAECILKRFA